MNTESPLFRGGLIAALLIAGPSLAVATRPTPTALVDPTQATFSAGQVTGPVGTEPDSLTSSASAGEGTASARFGHQVSGSECGPASDDRQQSNVLSLTFTRDATNHTVYNIASNCRMTAKTRNRRSLDGNCPPGPPTWAPAPWVRATSPLIRYPGTSNPSTGGLSSGGGAFEPAPVPHVPGNPNGTNEGSTGANTPAGSTGGTWRSPNPPGGVPDPDPGAGTRGSTLEVSTTVTSRMAGTAIEIIVPFDNLSVTETLYAKITPK